MIYVPAEVIIFLSADNHGIDLEQVYMMHGVFLFHYFILMHQVATLIPVIPVCGRLTLPRDITPPKRLRTGIKFLFDVSEMKQ